jgi:hypothetical protein
MHIYTANIAMTSVLIAVQIRPAPRAGIQDGESLTHVTIVSKAAITSRFMPPESQSPEPDECGQQHGNAGGEGDGADVDSAIDEYAG